MALHIIEAQPLSGDAFAPYGEVIAIPTENPGKISDRYNFWPKLAVMDVDGQLQIGVSTFFKRPFRLDRLERHYHTDELMIPLTGPVVIVFARHMGMEEDEVPDCTSCEAFLIQPQQGIVVKRGVWHWTPMPMEDNTSIICSFKTATEQNDVIIRPLPTGEIVEVKP